MDDSLSAVDGETEAAILNNLNQERKGKTNIITAHRMSAVRQADLILVMEDGEIKERGDHNFLMNNNGWYSKTYRAQSLKESLSEALDESLKEGDDQ